MKKYRYFAAVRTSRWVNGHGWEWKDEGIASEELTELDAMDTIYILKTGDGEWAQWADVMGDAVPEYEATDWEDAETDDQWTIAIYRVAEDEEVREKIYEKSIWSSVWAEM